MTRDDPKRALDAAPVPEDASEYADALAALLARIPDGWERLIDCGPGWYGVLVDLDARLSELLPSYELHQVKQKCGTLRWYWSPGEDAQDPHDPDSPTEALERRIAIARQLVLDAEVRAAVTCELCAQPGEMHCTRIAFRTYRTLCPACANAGGYVRAPELEAEQ